MKKHKILLVLLLLILNSGCFLIPTPEKIQKECPAICDDKNPCTIDTCDETTNFECQNTITNGPTVGCQLQTCDGECVCTSDPNILCSSNVDIGTGKEYTCMSGQCVAKAKPGVCGNGECETANGENFDTCPITKGGDCPYIAKCGNAICDQTESCKSCSTDCGSCLAVGHLNTDGLYPYNTTTRKYLPDIGIPLISSSEKTSYVFHFSNIDKNAYPLEDKLQQVCEDGTGNLCQRIDTYATITNKLNEPIKDLTYSFKCIDKTTGLTEIDSTKGYDTGYLQDWNVLSVPRPSRVTFVPETNIDENAQNIQAKAHFYIPNDVKLNSDDVSVILNTDTNIGTRIVYLAPLKSAGIQFNLLTLAPPTENRLYDCYIKLKGTLNDGNTVKKSIQMLVDAKHPNLLCNESVIPQSCKRYTFKNNRCIIVPINDCCGNGICETGETYSSCSADCTYTASCNNGVCDSDTENWWTCYQDCGYSLRIGHFESDNNTILSGNSQFKSTGVSSYSSINAGGSSHVLIESSSTPLEAGWTNVCTQTTTHKCQRIDASIELKNDTNVNFDNVSFNFTCYEPDTDDIILKSVDGSKNNYMNDWNISTTPTGKPVWRVPISTAKDGEQIQAKAYFRIPLDQMAYTPKQILLDEGSTTGTKAIALGNERIIDFNISFMTLVPNNSNFLFRCKINFIPKSGSLSQTISRTVYFRANS